MWGLIVGIILGFIAMIAVISGCVYFVKNSRDEHRGKGYFFSTIGGVIVGGIIAGLFTIFGGLHTVKNNEIAIVRNSVNGNIKVVKNAGLSLYSPFESLHRMTTTQVDYHFGNDDPNQGIDGYIPFNDKSNNEFNASVYVKWEANHNNLTEAIKSLYSKTGNTDIKADQIISTVRSELSQQIQDYAKSSSAESGVNLISQKAQITEALMKYFVEKESEALKAYGIKITQVIVRDIVAPKTLEAQIKAVSEAATQKEVQTRAAEAKLAELEVAKAQQAISGQEAVNKLISNPYVSSFLISHGVDISQKLEMSEILKAFASAGTDLQTMIKQDQYFSKWDGQLPKVMGQGQTGTFITV